MAAVVQPVMDDKTSIPHIPVQVQVATLPASLLPVLQSFWGAEARADHVQFNHLSGAMTNHVYRCDLLVKGTAACGGTQTVIARVAGQEGNPNSAFELACCVAAASSGLGAQLLGTFENGRIEQYLKDYRTMTALDLQQVSVSAGIAKAMARFHQCMSPQLQARKELPSCNLWDRMLVWAQQAQQLCQRSAPQGAGSTASTHLKPHTIDQLCKQFQCILPEVLWLRDNSSVTQDLASWAVLGHNDAQDGNIMLRHQSPGATGDLRGCLAQHERANAILPEQAQLDISMDIKLIDYDYTCWSEASFDIANHWCELAANYHTSQPHLLDYHKFPTAAQQRLFVRAYLQEMLPGMHMNQPSMRESLQGHMAAAAADGAETKCMGVSALEPAGTGSTPRASLQDAQPPPYILQLQSTLQACTLREAGEPRQKGISQHASCMCHTQGADPTLRDKCIHDWVAGCLAEQELQASCGDATRDGGGPNTGQHGCRKLDRDAILLLEDRLHLSGLAWTAVSHLHWALWGVIQHHVSTIDFDFLSYGDQRWQQYCLVRDVLMDWLSHATS